MENPISEDAVLSPRRPAFLTVLCILTFIGSGFGLFADVLSLLSIAPFPLKDTTTTGTILELVGCLLCLSGAIRMWSLHKDGFWIYVLGFIFSIACVWPVIHTALHNKPNVNGRFWLGIVSVNLVYIVFVILYGVNKKHLVK